MSNLLPRDLKARVRREYRLRVASVAAFVVASALGGVAILLAPSFMLVSSKLSLAEAEFDSKDSSMSEAYTTAADKIKRANTFALRLAGGVETISVTSIISELEREAGSGINIRGVVATRAEDGSYAVELRGVATTRDELARFIDRLKASSVIASADVPFSDLAKARDADFTASLTIVKPK